MFCIFVNYKLYYQFHLLKNRIFSFLYNYIDTNPTLNT